ncbi:FprA family A-type flavoprotein [Candidatus Bathyarchaeota archaeon]|jgi:flavodoxin I|nr:FprA family A-type flavoprotein [Candidatus Bathyarchaeota archaeon]MBT4320790.1 FprA family A-type flavoprotein [Candidatus Bathyarchaeota archaeon]MBT4423064.1 FprA family A-type flavoprotein [Candidatus Bathyarchaeota archaeon]MBT6605660.1 FprA family A-type flavoprotein [Candidatus Bathyarchaeota archaeon]MBT7186190.1 FprA family A-type flavoprotein [Candidatus Bathyarchaeota archaeon]
MKIVVIYDSKTGNTEKMAKALAEGASEHAEVEVMKIGEAFPLTIIADADGVIFGSPVYYADISNGMKDFLEHVETYIKANKRKLNNKPAAVFGSYGYDGAWIMEERLKERIMGLGYEVSDDVLVMIDSDIKYNFDTHSEKCKKFGKEFVENF